MFWNLEINFSLLFAGLLAALLRRRQVPRYLLTSGL